MRFAVLLLALAAALPAAPVVETGEINGAKFRIDVPDAWSGVLVMYCHGYGGSAKAYADPKPHPLVAALMAQGAAVAQSAFAGTGWAIQEGVHDTEALRRYFTSKYGAPKETYVTGHSMGGFLTMTILERFPTTYDGGLPLCGPLAPASLFMMRRVFDMRVVFDYYFPDALPAPDRVSADSLRKLLAARPAAAEAFRRYTGIADDKQAAETVAFFTAILKELQQRAGGNAFDNRNTIYENAPDSDALNDGVKRYTADKRAVEYLEAWYTPTGQLKRPMLAIHTTYDPLVPPWVPGVYATMAPEALFVQQYVKHAGHCAITPEETAKAFTQLREWRQTGKRPPAGLNR